MRTVENDEKHLTPHKTKYCTQNSHVVKAVGNVHLLHKQLTDTFTSLAHWQSYGMQSYFCKRHAQKGSRETKEDCYNLAGEAQDHKV